MKTIRYNYEPPVDSVFLAAIRNHKSKKGYFKIQDNNFCLFDENQNLIGSNNLNELYEKGYVIGKNNLIYVNLEECLV